MARYDRKHKHFIDYWGPKFDETLEKIDHMKRGRKSPGWSYKLDLSKVLLALVLYIAVT